MRCASVWECPVCQTRIQNGRAAELRRFGEAHRAKGGELYLATLTVRHHQGDELRRLRRYVAQWWRRVQAGRAWLEQRDRVGIRAHVRALEVTTGPNGWHPHLHVLVATARPLSDEQEQDFRAFLRRRWRDEVARVGWKVPSETHGVTLQRAGRDDYVTKLVAELVRGGRKQGRGGEHRTPWQLLADVMDAGRPADIALWQEYAAEMRGARQLTWGGELRTKAARAAYGLEEQTDLELADEDAQPAVSIYSFDAYTWRDVADSPELAARLLTVAEQHRHPDDATDAVWRQLELFAGRDPPPF